MVPITFNQASFFQSTTMIGVEGAGRLREANSDQTPYGLLHKV